MMSNELKVMRIKNRISLLESRGEVNRKIIKKLQRRLRALA